MHEGSLEDSTFKFEMQPRLLAVHANLNLQFKFKGRFSCDLMIGLPIVIRCAVDRDWATHGSTPTGTRHPHTYRTGLAGGRGWRAGNILVRTFFPSNTVKLLRWRQLSLLNQHTLKWWVHRCQVGVYILNRVFPVRRPHHHGVERIACAVALCRGVLPCSCRGLLRRQLWHHIAGNPVSECRIWA